MAQSQLTATSSSWIPAIPLPQPLSSWNYSMHHHARLISFAFLVKTGFHHVGQAGFELPTSGDLPASTSQSAGIKGMSHRAWPIHHTF